MAVPQNQSADRRGPRPLRVHVDVTDAVRTSWAGGIQRVVRQLCRHLLADDRVELVPMVWSRQLAAFRRLTAEELARLAEQPAGGAVQRPAPANRGGVHAAGERLRATVGVLRRSLGRVRRGLAGLLERAGLKAPIAELVRRAGLATVHRSLRSEALDPMPPGSVLFELDAVWNVVGLDRGALHRELRSRGVTVAVLVYDLLTQEHPEWFEPPVVALSATVLEDQARHADVVLAISQHTADSFVRWAKERDLTPPDPVVVALGADVEGRSGAGPVLPGELLPVELQGRRYLLVVGTVEPRKNHSTLLDAYERLEAGDHAGDQTVDLVVVGRPGWCNDTLIERLRDLSQPGSRVHWFDAVDDALLSTLYRNAFLVTVPSITEGYGLPVIEALGHGVPVISSNGGALPEAGGDLVEYAEPDDAAAWAALIARHLDDPDHHRRRRERAGGFRPPTWQQAADAVVRTLDSHR